MVNNVFPNRLQQPNIRTNRGAGLQNQQWCQPLLSFAMRQIA